MDPFTNILDTGDLFKSNGSILDKNVYDEASDYNGRVDLLLSLFAKYVTNVDDFAPLESSLT